MNWYSHLIVAAVAQVTLDEAYKLFGLTRGQTNLEQLKAAYRKMAMMYHPDRHPENQKAMAEEQFKKVNEANFLIMKDLQGGGDQSAGMGNDFGAGAGQEQPDGFYYDEDGRLRYKAPPNASGFEAGFADWYTQQGQWEAELEQRGYTEEQIREMRGYDEDDQYMLENDYVAHSMRERNDRYAQRDFQDIVDSGSPVQPPEVVGRELAAYKYNGAINALKKMNDSLQTMNRNGQFTNDIQAAWKMVMDNFVKGNLQPSDSNGKDVASALASMVMREVWKHVRQGSQSFGAIQFFRNTLPGEREQYGIYTPQDLDDFIRYTFKRGTTELNTDESAGNSGQPGLMHFDRVMNAAKQAQEYNIKVNQVENQVWGELAQKAMNGDFSPVESPSEQLFSQKVQPLVQQVVSQVGPEAQNRIPEIVESLKDYVAQGRHDWEPDAGVYPYNADVTTLEMQPKLDEYLAEPHNQKQAVDEVVKQLRHKMDWEKRRATA